MSLVKEFREFAMRGNVVDLAVGVVIGTAFGKIVTSMVGDIIMPAVGSLVKLDFSRYKYVIEAGAQGKDEVAVRFGIFAQTVIDFLIIAMCIFAVVKLMNAAKRKQAEAPAPPPPLAEDVLLLREIRDELKKR
jgi:large conductance mechanosensitive channel